MNIKLSGAYLAGKYHSGLGMGCQDYCEYRHYENHITAVLADGAGSKSKAEESAKFNCKCVMEFFEENPPETVDIDSIPERLTQYIDKRYTKSFGSADTDSFGSTLMFVIVMNSGEYIAAHIGDGIIIKLEDEASCMLSPPENGRFINETFFVPGRYAKEHLRVYSGKLNGSADFILTSDGLSDLLYDSIEDKAAGACFIIRDINKELTEQECSDKLHKELENFFSQYTDDDMSITSISFLAL